MRFNLRAGVRRWLRLDLRTQTAIHADADEELDALIAARIDSLIARGMSPAAARAEALRRLGENLETVRDQLHHSAEHRERRMQMHEHIESVLQDLQYAMRGLAHRPGFTAVAVLTLAIGIGATTAIFSAVNVLLLRPLPYAKPDELMKVTLVTPPRGDRPGSDQVPWSYPKFLVFRNAQHAFAELSLYNADQFKITSGDIERVRGESVGATYLRTLGLTPAHGRDFDRSVDTQYGARHETILSYAFWQRRFNADPSVIGRTIDLDQVPYDIIGVAPAGFRGLTGQAEIFVPVTVGVATDFPPQLHWLWLVARRAPHLSAGQAAAAVVVLGKHVSDAVPNSMDKASWGAMAEPLNNARVAPVVRRSVLVLFGSVALVLLIACVNVANLLLGRAAARRREIAVRLAIGAGRARLVRLLLTESLLLALLGGVASVVVAWIGVHAIGTVDPATTLRVGRDNILGAIAFSSITLDWTALAFAFGVALTVGLAFGLAPALASTGASLAYALKDGRSEAQHGLRGRAFSGRRLLVVSEVALALVLLAGSGLMIRSLGKMLATDPGFDGHNVLTARFTAPRDGVVRDSLPSFYTQLLERVRAIPGVIDAGTNNCPPLSGGCASTVIRLLEHPEIDMAHAPSVGIDWVSSTWFSTMRIPLRRGRVLATTDRAGAPKVVVVNEAAAKAFWPNENPIGKRVELGMGGMTNAEVIGVVGDVRQRADSAVKPNAYIAYDQAPIPGMMIFIRTSRDAVAIAPELRRVIHELAPSSPIDDVLPMTARAADATARARFSAVLLGLFALTALSLAAIGIYGVMSLAVTARTREIGIRIALGADRGRVQRLVVGEGAALVALGAVAGIGGALLATRALRTLLFDLSPSDPATYVAIVVLLAAASLLASWLPARRASRVDPLIALRAD